MIWIALTIVFVLGIMGVWVPALKFLYKRRIIRMRQIKYVVAFGRLRLVWWSVATGSWTKFNPRRGPASSDLWSCEVGKYLEIIFLKPRTTSSVHPDLS